MGDIMVSMNISQYSLWLMFFGGIMGFILGGIFMMVFRIEWRNN
jgi:hypothetical protein